MSITINCRNVVTGAHYHFVSRWTSSTAYIVAALVMMVFVSIKVNNTKSRFKRARYYGNDVKRLLPFPDGFDIDATKILSASNIRVHSGAATNA